MCLVCEVLPSPYVVPGVGGWVGLTGNIDYLLESFGVSVSLYLDSSMAVNWHGSDVCW